MADGEYHLVADIWIMNAKGEVLLQKRSMEKETGPGLWCCTGGAAITGEDSAQAFIREMTEELGVAPIVEHAEIAFYHTKRNCHKDIWFVRQDIPQEAFHLQKEEVEAVKWVTLAQLEQEANDPTAWWRLSYLDRMLDYLKTKEQAGDD
jgi:isopentenyldiphosphate isomerase